MRKVFCETLGTTLHLPDKIERIVSFSPAVTETLFILGTGDEIAGVSAFCARPPEARRKKVLGSYNTVSMDTLKDIGPDVLFTTTGYPKRVCRAPRQEFSRIRPRASRNRFRNCGFCAKGWIGNWPSS